MKPVIFLLTVIFLCRAAAEDVVLNRIHSADGDGWVDHCLDRVEFAKIPEWEPMHVDKAPLSRDEAVEIAKRTASASGVGEKAEMEVSLETLNRYEKDLLKRLPTSGCRWFYVVEFREEKRRPVFVVIAMNGAVAKPVSGKK